MSERITVDGEHAVVDGKYRFECDALHDAVLAAETPTDANQVLVNIFYNDYHLQITRSPSRPASVWIIPTEGICIHLTPEEVSDIRAGSNSCKVAAKNRKINLAKEVTNV